MSRYESARFPGSPSPLATSKIPGVPRGNAFCVECLQNLVCEAIDEERMAWIDVVVVNRDGWMKTANLAQCLSEERPLPDVKLKNQGQNETSDAPSEISRSITWAR